VRAMLVLLEKRGLVARERHPIDGRAHSVTLTRQGRQTLERLWTVSDPLRKRLADALQPEEADTLVQLLGRLCEALAQKKRQTRSGSKVSATSGR
jgi:DNA-binding MarR family transcriptional regulator